MLSRHLQEMPQDRLGRLRQTCRLRHAYGCRSRPLRLQRGFEPAREGASKHAVVVRTLRPDSGSRAASTLCSSAIDLLPHRLER